MVGQAIGDFQAGGEEFDDGGTTEVAFDYAEPVPVGGGQINLPEPRAKRYLRVRSPSLISRPGRQPKIRALRAERSSSCPT